MRIAPKITLEPEERQRLEKLASGKRTEVRVADRASVILLAADGLQNDQIAAELNISKPTVGLWRARYAAHGLAGIMKDATRPGRPRKDRGEVERRIVEAATQTKPANATHWSTRTLGEHLGMNHVMVHRVLRRNGLQPHRVRTFKLSNDPLFVEKLVDVVGLYLNPPEHAIVLSVDEKSQMQALDRTQPGLPIKKGRCGTMTHDYKRYGTTTLFAAIDMHEGKVISECMPRHRHQEWIKFLNKIDRETPSDLALHLILDNYATHKHPAVKAWLKRHPRFHFHFTPTSSSWLNVIERFFRDLSEKRLRRGAFTSVKELIAAVQEYIDSHNEDPAPFIWTAHAEKILAKVGRARAAIKSTSD